jgi:hypothetical protein
MNKDAASPPQSTSSWRHFGLTWHVLTSTHFSIGGHFYEKTDGVVSGSPRSPVIANFFVENLEDRALAQASLEDRALAQATHKPLCLLRYVDTSLIWPHRTETLEGFLDHLNGLHDNIHFTVEMEKDGHLSFLDIDIYRRPDGSLGHEFYRKTYPH